MASFESEEVDSARYPRKATGKSFVDVPPVSQISTTDDDTINLAKVHQLKDKDKISFSDIMERTERMLKYELLCNPPNKDGIGRHVFGMFSRSNEKVGWLVFNIFLSLFFFFFFEITVHYSVTSKTFYNNYTQILYMIFNFYRLFKSKLLMEASTFQLQI